jgi:hypothetical protein
MIPHRRNATRRTNRSLANLSRRWTDSASCPSGDVPQVTSRRASHFAASRAGRPFSRGQPLHRIAKSRGHQCRGLPRVRARVKHTTRVGKPGLVCGVCGHKHPATPEGWVAPHLSKRSGKDCPDGRLSLEQPPSPMQDAPPVPSEDYKYGSSSVRTVQGGLPGLGRRGR